MIKKFLALLLFTIILSGLAVQAAVNKVAVIDISKVISKSSQVQALKKEQENKKKELAQFIQKAGNEIKAQTDAEKKKALAQKYDKELNAKREANAKVYKTKLEAIDKNITAAIAKQAKAMGYDLVISKGVVVYGGDDITETILKTIK